jgi:hypothetical protein
VGLPPNILPFTTAGDPGTEIVIDSTSGPWPYYTTPGAVVTDANGNLWFADAGSDFN